MSVSSASAPSPPRPPPPRVQITAINHFADQVIDKKFRKKNYAEDVGVWSPYGKVYHPHGEPHLALGRKPETIEELPDPPAEPEPVPEERLVPEVDPNCAAAADELDQIIKAYEEKLSKNGGGARFAGPRPGVFAHPRIRFFPRETLRSSEERIRNCQAGHPSIRNFQALAKSESAPELPSAGFLPDIPPPAPPTPPPPAAAPRWQDAEAPAPAPPKPPPDYRSPGMRQSQEFRAIQEAARARFDACLLYTSPSPRDRQKSRMPSSA